MEKNEIHTEAIGYSGKRTRQYDRFVKLVKKAEIEELVALMKHPKPAVRGYAFWALAKRHFEALEEIFVAHANDEELVFNMQGCMGGDAPAIEFTEWVVMPNMPDSNCMKSGNSAFERVRVVRRVLNE